MDLRLVRRSRCLLFAAVFSISGLGIIGAGSVDAGQDESPVPVEEALAKRACRAVRSPHFLLHTDLSDEEARRILDRLEAMLRKLSVYCGRPPRGVLEGYIVRNLDRFPLAAMAPVGIREVRTSCGVTLMRYESAGKRRQPSAVFYACDNPEVVQHEAVHAYCHQTFGNIGPIWYSEGLAELGRYWGDDNENPAVRADSREIDYLRNHPPQSLAATLAPGQTTGDGWKNYAARWALCHFLAANPNYSRQFQQLGRQFLNGQNVSFEQVFGASNRELFFEYLFFLQHISPGYRVDLCAWDWKRSFASLGPGGESSVSVAAGRGWQPSGLTVEAGAQYEFAAEGCWQVGRGSAAVPADGHPDGRGRLVAVLMQDGRLGEEWELGAKGFFQAPNNGNLYLRCRNAWNALDGDSGRIVVKLKRP